MPPRAIYEASRPIELVLEGENLTPDTLKLYHNGVLYTPLESSDTYAYYLLGENGTNKVMLNGKNFCTVIVKDVVVPEGLPTNMFMYRTEGTSPATGPQTPRIGFSTRTNCLQVPEPYSLELPNYIYKVDIAELTDENFTLGNCVMNAWNYETVHRFRCNLSVQDSSKPAYIAYQGFIIAVFNYHA